MTAPSSSSYRGWYYDRENGTLDIYYGEGGASDPVEIAQVDTSGLTVITGDLGVAAGTLDIQDGGTVTQNTNKGTGVTLNTHSGQITLNNASLAAAAEVTFALTNSTIAATDVVIAVHGSAGTAGAYLVQANTMASGSCNVTVANLSTGSLGEAIVVNFVVIKGASST